ncbi:MAG: efflux RND transporter periplasmic adaptor subunit [Phycisphaerae bacterium]|jgi:multidrug efflux pump subunit AcrA (membrane-fusion protein)
MKAKNKAIIAAVAVIVIIAGVVVIYPSGHSSSKSGTKDLYYCPMHPNFTSDKPGDCAICGMSLVKRQAPPNQPVAGEKAASGEKKMRFYRNPMDPTVTSPVPMKDRMGMDYVPVYEEEKTAQAAAGVYISSQRQQLIGVKKEKIEKRRLAGQILTVGIVAYDPDLFVAQQEYLQSIQTRQAMQSGSLKYSDEQLNPLVNAARRKLLLLGMGDSEIAELEKKGQPQQYLYLPENGNVWVYVTIYEYEMAFIKEGLPVRVETVAYPGQVFDGNVVSVAPIFDRIARTLKVRVLVKDPGNRLKPEMYVDVKIFFDLGKKLAVPEQAVMDSGTRKIVYITDPNGYFEARDVKLGPKAQGYYEVLDGLAENQTVVTSGNFLIDSESKLNAVLTQGQEANK